MGAFTGGGMAGTFLGSGDRGASSVALWAFTGGAARGWAVSTGSLLMGTLALAGSGLGGGASSWATGFPCIGPVGKAGL